MGKQQRMMLVCYDCATQNTQYELTREGDDHCLNNININTDTYESGKGYGKANSE